MNPALLFDLHIAPTPIRASLPWPGEVALGVVRGGRFALLEWLETQLGLAGAQPELDRTLSYRSVLDERLAAGELEAVAESLRIDPLGTSSALLARRDDLWLHGWDGIQAPTPLIAALAQVEASWTSNPRSSEAERVDGVRELLERGRSLPSHRLVIEAPIAQWPRRWRPVLERLSIVDDSALDLSPPEDPGADAPRALAVVRAALSCSFSNSTEPSAEAETPRAHDREFAASPDTSLEWWRAASASVAVEAVASWLNERSRTQAGGTDRVVVLCEDEWLALQLDAALERRGASTLGVAVSQAPLPAVQVLPLALELGWDPLDPQAVLDFLTLPVSPIPGKVAWRLARAMGESPGLGSEKWNEALRKLEDEADDPQRVRQYVADWLEGERFDRSSGLPREWVIDCARRVASWARGRAGVLREKAGETSDVEHESGSGSDGPATPGRAAAQDIAAFLGAARQADLLVQMIEHDSVESEGSAVISEPQLARYLHAARRAAPLGHARPRLVGGARWVRSLSALVGDSARFDDLIWLGTSSRVTSTPLWTSHDLRELAQCGIELDDGSQALRRVRDAELRALCGTQKRLIAIEVPQDSEQRPHPLWLRIREGLVEAGPAEAASDATKRAKPRSLEKELNAGPGIGATSSPLVHAKSVALEPQLRPPTVWTVDPQLLQDRQRSSASSLGRRLKCPLAWTLHYGAKLRKSETVRVELDNRLKGTFAHHVLERVLPCVDLDDVDAVLERVQAEFEARLPREAAPLTLASAVADRRDLREDLLRATRRLVEALQRGGYRIVAMEGEYTSPFEGRELHGFIDCLVIDDDGREAVIDFKYTSWERGRREELEKGTALQLATYAALRRHEAPDDRLPRVAYLMLQSGRLLTPEGSPLRGSEGTDAVVAGAPAIGDVWAEFVTLLESTEAWLDSGEIPVRPRQPSSEWPDGLERILDPKKPVRDACFFCDYKVLCGVEEVQ